MGTSLEGRVAVVTGSAMGMGQGHRQGAGKPWRSRSLLG